MIEPHDHAALGPPLAAYARTLSATRGLAPATLRNYLADVAPFIEYLAAQRLSLVPLGPDEAQGDPWGATPPLTAHHASLRAFIERRGPAEVAREYRNLVRDYVAWLVEQRTLGAGRRAGARGHSRGSVIRCLVALRGLLRYLIARGLMPEAPIWAPRSTLMRRFTPKPQLRLPDTLSLGEAARLVEAPVAHPPGARAGAVAQATAKSLRDLALLELLYGSGLRVSEAVGLDQADVRLDARTARVWGKGSKGRVVPVGSAAAEALRRYLVEGRAGLATGRSGAALFLSVTGRRLSARAVQALVARHAAAAGVRPGVHPHTLRHTFATHLLDGGADLRVVQMLLGHASPAATQVYTHVSQAEARRVYLSAHPLARTGAPATGAAP